MNYNPEKAKTYVGFAIKSRKIKFGVDDILKLKNAELILVSDSLTRSGMNKLEGFSLKANTSMIVLKASDFLEIIQNTSVKAAAILDVNLADAIKKNLTSN